MLVRAAVLRTVGAPIDVCSLRLEPPRSREVLVRMSACGVCHSDWHLCTGDTRHPLPVVLGHEGAGVVVETGPDVTAVQPGDAIALNWAPYCGDCFYCRKESQTLCEAYAKPLWDGTLMDGTDADLPMNTARPSFNTAGWGALPNMSSCLRAAA